MLLMAVTGGLIAMQPASTRGSARRREACPPPLVSFGVGSLLLAAIVVVSGKAGGVSATFDVRWYYLLGGVLGAAYVFAALHRGSSIGAGASPRRRSPASSAMSVFIDRIGFLGLEQQPITAERPSASRCCSPARS